MVIAAPASGSGKTTVATGLIGALRRAGERVAPFKVGPDFIDPGYHGLAAGRPGRNLDPVLVGDDLVGPLFCHGANGADIAVVEGVMGLFDGRIEGLGERSDRTPDAASTTAARGSTAHVAGLLHAPVVLVVDARGQSQSLAALLHGFATFDPHTRVAGVILNRVGSARHEAVLRQACTHTGLPVLGAIPRAAELQVPSRHLGLVTAAEHGAAARAAVTAMTELVGRHVDLAALRAVARSAVTAPAWDPAVSFATATPATIAVAAGRAFSFGYAEHVELLRAAGADIAVFDPLGDDLPTGTTGLVLPGGFPEEHAAELAANVGLRAQVADLAARGGPVHAECGGLTYLMDALDGHPMCGVLRGTAAFTARLTLGYRDAVAVSESPLHAVGERVVGHEFHRTAVEFGMNYPPAWAHRGGPDGAVATEGAVHRGVHASYLHTHPAAQPAAAARFVARAAALRLPPMWHEEKVEP